MTISSAATGPIVMVATGKTGMLSLMSGPFVKAVGVETFSIAKWAARHEFADDAGA